MKAILGNAFIAIKEYQMKVAPLDQPSSLAKPGMPADAEILFQIGARE